MSRRNSLAVLAMSVALAFSAGSVFAQRPGGRRGGGRGRGMQMQPQVNSALAGDRTAVNTASSDYTKAQKDYNEARVKFEADYHKKPDYAAAQKAVDDAESAVDDTHDAIEADLKKNNKDYQAALAQEAADQKRLDQLKAEGGSHDEIAALADSIFNAKSEKILQAAVDSSVPYTEVKKKLADAVAALKVQKDKMADAEKADDTLSKLKDKMDASKATLDDARKKLASDTGG